jgi:signal transduction histidine kinase
MTRKKDIGFYAIYLLLLTLYFFWNAPNTFFNMNDEDVFNSRMYAYANTPIIILTHITYIYFLKHFFYDVIKSNRLNKWVYFFTMLAPVLIVFSLTSVYLEKSNQYVFYIVNFFSTGISIYILGYIFKYKIKGVHLVVIGMALNIFGNALTVLMILLWREKVHHILTDGYPLFFMRCGILADIFLYMIAILQKLNLHEKQLAIQKLESQLAVEKLKNTIGKELHDDIGSTLSGINMYSHMAQQQAEQGNASAANKTLAIIQQASDEMIYKLKDMLWEIQPDNKSFSAVTDKIKEYAVFITGAKKIDLQTNFSKDVNVLKIPAEKQHHIYNLAKEALNNAVKYSCANLITIDATVKEGVFMLSIRDNGVGFDKQQVVPGNGLLNMQKRAGEMGGDFSIVAEPLQGCSISLTLKSPIEVFDNRK